ncbi:MAG: bifunctional hydroxymethylpyrimidine kinase/phosphomethylpyrimidine kinase [Candidatus Hadarchaeales archaeon]
MKIPCALTIAGSDSCGGAGVQADIKTFSALGVHGRSVLTAVTAQKTRVPPEMIEKQLQAVLTEFNVEWCKTGMLWSTAGIEVVEKAVKRHGLKLVVDPVMVATSGSQLLRGDAFPSLLKLLETAVLVTPNVDEASKILGKKITSSKDAENAARKIASLGPKAVLIKGGHLPGKEAVDVLFYGKKIHRFTGRRITDEKIHGAGCSFSAAITAELAKGLELPDAVASAKKFIESAIERRVKVGRGVAIVNPGAQLWLSAEEGKAMREVWEAAKALTKMKNFCALIPEVGSNLAMALPWARSRAEVVGLSGRIIRRGDAALLTGFPELGGSEHVANFVLTAHRHDPRIRAGLNIKYSREILAACKKLGLKISTFERRNEPKGTKTMIWGTEQAIKKFGGVPDVIYDRGSIGKEPMIRLLAETPQELVKRVEEILKVCFNYSRDQWMGMGAWEG